MGDLQDSRGWKDKGNPLTTGKNNSETFSMSSYRAEKYPPSVKRWETSQSLKTCYFMELKEKCPTSFHRPVMHAQEVLQTYCYSRSTFSPLLTAAVLGQS